MSAKSTTPSPRRGGFRYPLLFGFLLGALGTWLVYDHYWLLQQFDAWFDDGGAPSAPATTDAKRQPRYVFYTELSEQEVVVLEEELVDAPTTKPEESRTTATAVASSKATTEAEATTTTRAAVEAAPDALPLAVQYILQAGSFRLPEEADSLRAKLALAGFQVRIQTVQINGTTTWHRVRVGPYNSKLLLQQAQQRLQQQGIQPLALRLKPRR